VIRVHSSFLSHDSHELYPSGSNKGDTRIGYSIPGHSIWKRMHWGEAEMHSFSYTNDQVLYN
jgi:hypothetical protein